MDQEAEGESSMTDIPEVVEQVARAIQAAAFSRDVVRIDAGREWRAMEIVARAAIEAHEAALAAAGLVIVPREPTEAMIEAAADDYAEGRRCHPRQAAMTDDTANDNPGPLSTMHLRCASALWRRQVEAEGHVWSANIPIPPSVFEEARVVLEPLLKPSVEMVNAMVAPIISRLPAWDVNSQTIARAAAHAAAEQWIDGVRAILGRKAEAPKSNGKANLKLIRPSGTKIG